MSKSVNLLDSAAVVDGAGFRVIKNIVIYTDRKLLLPWGYLFVDCLQKSNWTRPRERERERDNFLKFSP